jgi:hypothetical protein
MERGLFLELYFFNFSNQICGILKILKDVGEVFEPKHPHISRVQAIKLYLENSSVPPSHFLPHHYPTIHPKPKPLAHPPSSPTLPAPFIRSVLPARINFKMLSSLKLTTSTPLGK